jgi:hypothetical protein
MKIASKFSYRKMCKAVLSVLSKVQKVHFHHYDLNIGIANLITKKIGTSNAIMNLKSLLRRQSKNTGTKISTSNVPPKPAESESYQQSRGPAG